MKDKNDNEEEIGKVIKSILGEIKRNMVLSHMRKENDILREKSIPVEIVWLDAFDRVETVWLN